MSTSTYTYDFTTTAALNVISSNPVNNATGVSTTPTITVTFNEPISAGSDNIVLKLTANPGTVIPTTLSISGNILTIKPDMALAKGNPVHSDSTFG